MNTILILIILLHLICNNLYNKIQETYEKKRVKECTEIKIKSLEKSKQEIDNILNDYDLSYDELYFLHGIKMSIDTQIFQLNYHIK